MKSLNILIFAYIINFFLQEEKLYMQIDFQDNFKNDTISITFQNKILLENYILNSDVVDGLTDLIIKFMKTNKKLEVFLSEKRKFLFAYSNTSKNHLIIKLNGKEKEMFINLKKGRYLGVMKNEDKICITQSELPFEYD